MSRARWALRGGLGLYAAIGVMTLVVMIGIGLGSVSAGGSDVATPIVGTLVLGLYALALAGIGIAFGGLVTTSFAGEIIALLVILTFVIDTVVPALKLPDWIQQLALTAHLGHPMVGAVGLARDGAARRRSRSAGSCSAPGASNRRDVQR